MRVDERGGAEKRSHKRKLEGRREHREEGK